MVRTRALHRRANTDPRTQAKPRIGRPGHRVTAEFRIIASPYFPPGSTSHIKDAIDHHVRVVVFTNSLGATDEPLVHRRYARYRRAMLKLGVGIYELSADLTRDTESFGNFGKSLGRLHAKVAIVDQRYLFI